MRYLDITRLRWLRFSRTIGFFCFILAAFALCRSALGGGGPENILLVVNPRSPDSMAIANAYLRLREIPPGNVLYLPWEPKGEFIAVDSFRTTFLKPILETIQSRRLAGQIDYVVYSSDFPTQVKLDSDFDKFKNPPAAFKIVGVPRTTPVAVLGAPMAKEWKTAQESAKAFGVSPDCSPVGSLSGMTYLYQWVMQGSADYATWQCNGYFRKPVEEQKNQPTLGFRRSWKFGRAGELVEKDGPSYMLSVMLGATTVNGNTREEILRYLERNVKADGTFPKGTIYFMRNNDVRSAVRDNLFPEVLQDLEKLGVQAKIVTGTVPINRDDVQGVCMGTADFDWKASKSEILPGALCEHFTSYGGILTQGYSQTKLSEFLRYGAAGASGTVTEPHATWQKFPLPTVQVHYARGCTLAEAFYQSVYGPYQLLIVGDPLCRPWANIPVVEVSGVRNGDTVKGDLTLTPTAKTPREGSIHHFELFVSGSRASQCKPGDKLKLDTALLADGYQELRVVAVENSIIQSQGRKILDIKTNNQGRKIDVRKVSPQQLKLGEKLAIELKSPNSIGIGIMHNGRLVGHIAGEEGTAEIDTEKLGPGKVRLQAIGFGKGGGNTHTISDPIEVEITAKN